MEIIMSETNEKSWKDRVPPDGHLPPSYEVQVCDEGNKVIAVQMLNKAQLSYKIAVRQGQFYIATDDMETFTKVKSVLNQTLDGSKEAAHTGVPVEVTPVGSNVTEPTPVAEDQKVTEEKEIYPFNAAKQRAQDLLDVSKYNSKFLKRLDLQGSDWQNLLDVIESAWDLGFDSGTKAASQPGFEK